MSRDPATILDIVRAARLPAAGTGPGCNMAALRLTMPHAALPPGMSHAASQNTGKPGFARPAHGTRDSLIPAP